MNSNETPELEDRNTNFKSGVWGNSGEQVVDWTRTVVVSGNKSYMAKDIRPLPTFFN